MPEAIRGHKRPLALGVCEDMSLLLHLLPCPLQPRVRGLGYRQERVCSGCFPQKVYYNQLHTLFQGQFSVDATCPWQTRTEGLDAKPGSAATKEPGPHHGPRPLCVSWVYTSQVRVALWWMSSGGRPFTPRGRGKVILGTLSSARSWGSALSDPFHSGSATSRRVLLPCLSFQPRFPEASGNGLMSSAPPGAGFCIHPSKTRLSNHGSMVPS